MENSSPDIPNSTAWSRLVELVRLEQTVFALPFAFSGLVLGSGGWPRGWDLLWVTLAMVGARTAGMSANRLFDAKIDAANPRTSSRLIPSGRIRPFSVSMILAGSLTLFWLAASQLHPTCLKLWPVAVFLLLVYSLLKRFTALCHLGLGMVQACAPLGGWLAVRGAFEAGPVCLALAILLWVAGFDILYACQDEQHDREHGLHSIPARMGRPRAFRISRSLHVGAVLSLLGCGLLMGLGAVYFGGVALISLLLVWEHQLLSPDDLSKMQQAFFWANALVSLTLLLSIILEVCF